MNKAFRIVWNHARNAFVVVDELASHFGRRSGARLLLATSLLGNTMPALAGTGSCASSGVNIINGASTTQCALGTGDSVVVTSSGSIATAGASAITANDSNGGVINGGSITSTGGFSAITIQGPGSNTTTDQIVNYQGAEIIGSQYGIALFGGGGLLTIDQGIDNAGTIKSTNIGAAIFAISTEIESFNNSSTGVIIGEGRAIVLSSSNITNDFNNYGSITNTENALGYSAITP